MAGAGRLPCETPPSPEGEDFYLMFGNYLPVEAVLDGTYEYQPVRKTNA